MNTNLADPWPPVLQEARGRVPNAEFQGVWLDPAMGNPETELES